MRCVFLGFNSSLWFVVFALVLVLAVVPLFLGVCLAGLFGLSGYIYFFVVLGVACIIWFLIWCLFL